MATPASNQVARSDVSTYSPTAFTLNTTAFGPWVAQPASLELRLYSGGLVSIKFQVNIAVATGIANFIGLTDPIPALFRPAVSQFLPTQVVDNGLNTVGLFTITSGGSILLGLSASANFTGTCGTQSMTVTYQQ